VIATSHDTNKLKRKEKAAHVRRMRQNPEDFYSCYLLKDFYSCYLLENNKKKKNNQMTSHIQHTYTIPT
jgi:hypothetical protein